MKKKSIHYLTSIHTGTSNYKAMSFLKPKTFYQRSKIFWLNKPPAGRMGIFFLREEVEE